MLTHPLRAGTFVRCSSESPLSLADGVGNILKEVSQGATKIPSRTRVVLLRKRKGKSVFDWGWLELSLVESSSQECSSHELKYDVSLSLLLCPRSIRHPLRGTSAISELTSCVANEPTVPGSTQFGAGVAWSSCLSPRLPRITHYHRYNPAVTRTSCALAKYGASDLCPGLTNFIGSPLSPGQTCYHQVPKHLCHAAVANLVRSRNCHYASRGVGCIALRD
ncbi:hypothetical protein PIB30_035184 [Stylosanthes scabra]|uniref:Uncharacterized protein n=1 Tax=Stylosanthes scabra TaxID=79078 RepID=A0ABU6ZAR0_9FABA|nr:hypothetical protein [Stylosanthes scabra]